LIINADWNGSQRTPAGDKVFSGTRKRSPSPGTCPKFTVATRQRSYRSWGFFPRKSLSTGGQVSEIII